MPTTVTRYTGTITTPDPANGEVGFVLKGDAQERQALVVWVPNAFRWPQAGETWSFTQINGTWYLEGVVPSLNVPTSFHQIPEGDLQLNAPTGIIHVNGSTDGSTDFTITAPPIGEPALSFGGDLQIVPTLSGTTSNAYLVAL